MSVLPYTAELGPILDRWFDRPEGSVAAEVSVGTVISDVNGIVPHTAVLKHITQPHTGEFGTCNCTNRPLISGSRWPELAAPVAGTFKLQLISD